MLQNRLLTAHVSKDMLHTVNMEGVAAQRAAVPDAGMENVTPETAHQLGISILGISIGTPTPPLVVIRHLHPLRRILQLAQRQLAQRLSNPSSLTLSPCSSQCQFPWNCLHLDLCPHLSRLQL